MSKCLRTLLALGIGWAVCTGPIPCFASSEIVPEPLAAPAAANVNHPFQRSFVLPSIATPPQDSKTDEKGRLRVGMRRDFAAPAVVDSRASPREWALLPDGSRLWAARVFAEGAKGMRVHVRGVALPAGVTLMVYANDHSGMTGLIDAEALGDSTELWMPSVLSEDLIFECRVPPDVGLEQVAFTLDGISHLYDSPAPAVPKVGGCHNDVSCYDPWRNVAAGVGRITFVENGHTYVCSGSLLNGGSSGPLFLTANHCVPNQAVASTLEVYWLFQTSACQGEAPTLSSVPRTTAGADYLEGARGNDFALLRLRRGPPAGVFYLSWSTQPVAPGEAIATVHHPGGSHKRISFGSRAGGDANFTRVRWSSGVTEPGSSGAPLLNSRQEVVGQLYGGSSSCGNPSGTDIFGRFDVTWQAAQAWLLDSGAAPSPEVQVPRGSYAGLIQERGGFSMESSGGLTLTTGPRRVFSGSLRMISGLHRFSGRFESSGSAEVLVRRGPWPALRLVLRVEPADPDRISGQFVDANWTAEVAAYRAVYNANRDAAPQTGRYTLAMPRDGAGDGIALGTITKAGRVTLGGRMPGGTPWTRSGFISKEGDFPMFTLVTVGREMLVGWIRFGAGFWSSPAGELTWKNRFDELTVLQVRGSRVNATSSGEPILTGTANVEFQGADVEAVFQIPEISKRRFSVRSAYSEVISVLFKSNGSFSGTLREAGFTRTIPFTGVLLQNEGAGFGLFSTPAGSGSVRITVQSD